MTDDFDTNIAHLKTLRDEIRVQIHLAKAELKDEWEELEDKWDDVEEALEEAKKDAAEVAEEARQTVNVIVEELGDAYRRIKERL